jgi:hypothetical protein
VIKLAVRTTLRKRFYRYRRKRRAIREKRRLQLEAENALRLIDKDVISAGKAARQKRSFRLLIGPTNSAGQAHQWALALSRQGIPSQSLRISNDATNEWFESDLIIPRMEWTTIAGRVSLAREVVSNFDAILIESMRPLFSLHTVRDYSALQTFQDIELLKRSKVKTAIVFHGSDIRDTEAHSRREKFSPYHEQSSELIALQRRATEFREAGREAIRRGIPVFVTSPDLLLDMPKSEWLPIAIDVEHFLKVGGKRAPWSAAGVVKVLFQPSRGWLKSASLVEPILHRLVDEGVIELIPNDPIAQHLMAERIASADVVIDRFDGIAGVASMEALAAGRLVIANIATWAYENAETTPPVLHATPETLEVTLRKVANEREALTWDSSGALEYVRNWHNGKESATRIAKRMRL